MWLNTMNTCFILVIIDLMINIISSVPYNQRCTFSSNTCDWIIGRRWQIRSFDEDTDDKVLIATDGSSLDQEMGFTDTISTSWLYLTSSCSYNVRLTFQFSIENGRDQIEIFLIRKDGSSIISIGRWKAMKRDELNVSERTESFWQQINTTFKAEEEFRIEIEVRHLANKRNDSTSWFAIDDILIENCPNIPTTTTTNIGESITMKPWAIPSYMTISNAPLYNDSFFRFRWKFNESTTPLPSSLDETKPSQVSLVTYILYILCALAGLSLLIIFLAIIIFIYRKYCLLPSISSQSILDQRYHSSRKKKTHRIGLRNSHVDQDARTEKTMVTTVRTYY